MATIRVAVSGAAGKMGREVLRAVLNDTGMKLIQAIDSTASGEDAGALAQMAPCGIHVVGDLGVALDVGADVLVDFTTPQSVMANIKTSIEHGVAAVVGTTGITSADLDQIREWCQAKGVPVLVAPNFAIGAILMMHCAAVAARHFNSAEIIELHHDQKLDAPSGTAIKTAEMILAAREADSPIPRCPVEKIPGVRGGEMGGIHMHSVRLPGLIAHQEVIFGNIGQTLTIRHDSISRESFMPGVLLAIRRIREYSGLVYGLEQILGL